MATVATGQLVPPPPNAVIVNFDDRPFPDDITLLHRAENEYTDLGITFGGFGANGAPIAGIAEDLPGESKPNVMIFVSAFPNGSGGLMQSPEIMSFYPPISHFQIDGGTSTIDCKGEQIFLEAQDADGNTLASNATTIPAFFDDGNPFPSHTEVTAALDIPAPGASKVILTTSHSCGDPGFLFFGVEVLIADNIAFVPVGTGPSSCAGLALHAAAQKAKAKARCYSRAVLRGVPVDEKCLAAAEKSFATAMKKAQKQGDCLTDADAESIEAAVDQYISDLLQAVNGGAPGPDICDSRKLSAAGRNALTATNCYSDGARHGAIASNTCLTKAGKSLAQALKNCADAAGVAPLQTANTAFAQALWRALTVPSTTTTTTTTTSTTTTTAPPLGEHVSFTTSLGTTDCGGASLNQPPAAPFSGEIDSDTMGTKITDLGLGCLYIGGGNSGLRASQVPDNATSILNTTDGVNLTASFGTGPADCSRGPNATRHCANDPSVECTSDVECAGTPGGCAFDPNCFFGPPVEVNGFPSSCVVNTFAADGSGTIDLSTGESSLSISLASRVYLTLGQPTVCPHCEAGTCNWGANAGGACTTSTSTLTSLDCPPSPALFVATLPVDLTPLTTGANTVTAADGNFCPGQNHPGAFGQATTQAITQNGSAPGDLTDGMPHPGTLVSNFCIPKTNSAALDSLGDLPGPGSVSLPGNSQFVSAP
ncbi:MAG TPA: hypothetical protein VFD84_14610 [Candidatus Binatia bacterium]|nr:hypothetical protein [Candidatus Binatia bacterium]